MPVGWGYFDRDGERWFSVGNNDLNFAAVEEIGLFSTHTGIFVEFKGFDVSGVYGEGESFFIETHRQE